MISLFGFEISLAMAWIAAGLALLLLEVTTGTLWLLWPGVAALMFAAVAALYPDLPIAAQLVMFAGLAAALTVLGQRYFRGRPAALQSDRPKLNDRSAQMVGRRVTAVGAFQNGRGAVRVDDGQWSARLATDAPEPIADGAALTVDDVDGVVLVVRPAAS